jgi:hypothetical protein
MPFVLIISLAGCIIRRNGQLERLVIGARSLRRVPLTKRLRCSAQLNVISARSDSGGR